MNSKSRLFALALLAAALPGCKQSGDHYQVNFKLLRQNTEPAKGFKIAVWVKGKSEPKTLVTDSAGLAETADLPQPDATHQLNANWQYYLGKRDQTREIAYPFIESDAKRLKDTQYIPNTATPEPS